MKICMVQQDLADLVGQAAYHIPDVVYTHKHRISAFRH